MKTLTRRTNSGFTLVELVIAVSIFLVLVMVLGGILISAINFQRTALATQAVQDISRSVLEIMGRDIRLAAKDEAGSCIAARKNYETTSGSIKFLNDRNECVRYYILNNEVNREVNGTNQLLSTAKSAKFSTLQFDVFGENGNDQTQPRVLVRLVVTAPNDDPGATLRIQTTLTQRELDVR